MNKKRLFIIIAIVLLFSCGTCGIITSLFPPDSPLEPNQTQIANISTIVQIPTTESPPTPTPPPSATPSLTDLAEEAFDRALRPNQFDALTIQAVNDVTVTASFPLSMLTKESAVFDANNRFVEAICELRAAGFTTQRFFLTGTIELVDAFGNTSRGDGIILRIEAETAAQINCENRYAVDLQRVAEFYQMHQALQ